MSLIFNFAFCGFVAFWSQLAREVQLSVQHSQHACRLMGHHHLCYLHTSSMQNPTFRHVCFEWAGQWWQIANSKKKTRTHTYQNIKNIKPPPPHGAAEFSGWLCRGVKINVTALDHPCYCSMYVLWCSTPPFRSAGGPHASPQRSTSWSTCWCPGTYCCMWLISPRFSFKCIYILYRYVRMYLDLSPLPQ